VSANTWGSISTSFLKGKPQIFQFFSLNFYECK
jgi:hypothetical protein